MDGPGDARTVSGPGIGSLECGCPPGMPAQGVIRIELPHRCLVRAFGRGFLQKDRNLVLPSAAALFCGLTIRRDGRSLPLRAIYPGAAAGDFAKKGDRYRKLPDWTLYSPCTYHSCKMDHIPPWQVKAHTDRPRPLGPGGGEDCPKGWIYPGSHGLSAEPPTCDPEAGMTVTRASVILTPQG